MSVFTMITVWLYSGVPLFYNFICGCPVEVGFLSIHFVSRLCSSAEMSSLPWFKCETGPDRRGSTSPDTQMWTSLLIHMNLSCSHCRWNNACVLRLSWLRITLSHTLKSECTHSLQLPVTSDPNFPRVCSSVCRRVVLPCVSFCEAAREGCEPVLQMFNATWPDFLRCSQFSNVTSTSSPPSSPSSPSTPSAGPAPPACYTPRQIKGKPCEWKHT